MAADLRSPSWLEPSVRYAEDCYLSDSAIAEKLASNPAVLKNFLSTISASLSNRQVRETADSAEHWMKDLIMCEADVDGELPLDLQEMKEAAYLILHLMKNSRSARSTSKGYRRQ